MSPNSVRSDMLSPPACRDLLEARGYLAARETALAASAAFLG